ncbi:MAG: redox-sensing transcriptional repressor Rex [Clostridia bacterium]|nr:redox-sensing transcriptional repressor Rex [Clostridia bacterium]
MRRDLKKNTAEVSPAVINRLPRYYRYLRELLRQGILRISSGELSEKMNVTASQIRQDLNCFGGFGQQGYGYNVTYLCSKISDILGVSNGFTSVIVGTGNMGRALAGSTMFEHRGVNLIGLFDNAPSVIGQIVDGYQVMDVETLPAFAEKYHIDIAILTVPKAEAETVAQKILSSGIRAIWNFSSAEILQENPVAIVENVHMGDSLMKLMFELRMAEENTGR